MVLPAIVFCVWGTGLIVILIVITHYEGSLVHGAYRNVVALAFLYSSQSSA